MIGDALRVELERYMAAFKRENPLYTAALSGAFTPEVASRYLVNVRHLLQHTVPYLQRATTRALARRDLRLAEHFQHKLAEERGHDLWADNDLERLSAQFGVTHPPEIVPALVGLLAYLEETIDRDPALYLAYILFVEYVTSDAGEWLELLEERCGIPRDAMSAIGKHVELDGPHTAEGFEAIDALVTAPGMLGPMRRALLRSRDYFQQFCTEVVFGPSAGCEWAVSATG